MNNGHLLLFTFFSVVFFSPSISTDTIIKNNYLREGDTLVSADDTFELGFFTTKSKKRYLGVWYKKIPKTVVWVANRENPLTEGAAGALKIDNDGRLILLANFSSTGDTKTLWFSESSKSHKAVVAELLDSGNLVLRFENADDKTSFLWQSFDYPTDTWLAGMKLGWDLKTGFPRYLHAWKSSDDPSLGDYIFKMDLRGLPQMFLYMNSSIIYRGGPWTGSTLSGISGMNSSHINKFHYVEDQIQVYYKYDIIDASVTSRFLVTSHGQLQRLVWLPNLQIWSSFCDYPKDYCDAYRKCGDYGVCDSNDSPLCNCLSGFKPQSVAAWELGDYRDGCVRDVGLDCHDDGFQRMPGMKLPDTRNATANVSLSLEECQRRCLMNCSCTAYASHNISGRGGCIIWMGSLIDIQRFPDGKGGGQELYIRLPRSVLGGINTSSTRTGSNKKKTTMVIVAASVIFLLALCTGGCWIRRMLRNRGKLASLPAFSEYSENNKNTDQNSTEERDMELQLFDIGTIAASTDDFSVENKLGEGGFGPVFKGKLPDGQEIAVKRLSEKSSQGLDEFKNEVNLIAKLQHRNLVPLLGCCIRGERMLIYEFMQNRSLDSFLFDKSKSKLLTWQRRSTIIFGIARGLLYLHQDSRLRIIHRDLKASNILLDAEMNPKISDFGMARIFGGDQNDERTRRVVGTYGYMSPEYAMNGVFSIKSDVFSFGVLILEIASGKKNRGVYQYETYSNLLIYAWSLWNAGKCSEFVDESIGNSYGTSEIIRCIQVALLCVQEQAKDRPTMSEVIAMLSGENTSLPKPKVPGFSSHRGQEHLQTYSRNISMNGFTVTMLEGR